MNHKITVTKDHISRENSEEGDGAHCMVANAIREQLQLGNTNIYVGYEKISIGGEYEGDSHGPVEIQLPHNVGDKIRRWDDGANTRPFEFELDLPKDWRKQVAKARAEADD